VNRIGKALAAIVADVIRGHSSTDSALPMANHNRGIACYAEKERLGDEVRPLNKTVVEEEQVEGMVL
jgi:hypothetical protein